MLKVEIGGGPHSIKKRIDSSWINLDQRSNPSFNIITDQLPYEDNTIDEVYMSHMIEHIPICKIPSVFKKIYNKLKPNGYFRIVCPDLEQICQAYCKGDKQFFKNALPLIGVSERLGIGGSLMASIVSFGSDTLLVTNNRHIPITGIAHCAGYDFQMIQVLAKEAGFTKCVKSKYNKNYDPHSNIGQLFVGIRK